jgi:2-methylcitrate dehydratase PrpD
MGHQESGQNLPIARALGDFVARAAWREMEGCGHEAKRTLLNFLGTALAAATDPALAAALRALEPTSGAPRATIIGRRQRIDALNAAFLNAASANFLDFDDTHLATIIHPGAPVAAAALALAEERGLPGRDVLQALILGVDVECRIGNSVSPGHYDRGWHITSTCGVFGAAAASARLLGLSAAETANALGIAASESAGIVENLPTAAKNVGVGNAARGGLLAALLAQQGYAAASGAIEGPLGWARAMGDVPRAEACTQELGSRWEILRNTYKPYPAGIVFHAVIDACLELRAKLAGPMDDVTQVVVEGPQLLLARGDRPVGNERDARVSIHHAAAVALLFGAAGVREFSAAMVDEPAVRAMRARVQAKLDAGLPTGAARVSIETRSGRAFAASVMHAKGSLERPMSDSEIEDKVSACAREGGFTGDVGKLIDIVWKLDEVTDVAALLALARPDETSA